MSFRVGFSSKGSTSTDYEELFRKEAWTLKIGAELYRIKSIRPIDNTQAWIDFEFPKRKVDAVVLIYENPDDHASFKISLQHERKLFYLPFALMPMDAGPCIL